MTSVVDPDVELIKVTQNERRNLTTVHSRPFVSNKMTYRPGGGALLYSAVNGKNYTIGAGQNYAIGAMGSLGAKPVRVNLLRFASPAVRPRFPVALPSQPGFRPAVIRHNIELNKEIEQKTTVPEKRTPSFIRVIRTTTGSAAVFDTVKSTTVTTVKATVVTTVGATETVTSSQDSNPGTTEAKTGRRVNKARKSLRSVPRRSWAIEKRSYRRRVDTKKMKESALSAVRKSVFGSECKSRVEPEKDASSPCWTQVVNSRICDGAMLTGNEIVNWNIEQVAEFISLLPYCAMKTAKKFQDELIDGEAMLLLTQEDIISSLGVKLGPAVKLYNAIQHIKHKTTL